MSTFIEQELQFHKDPDGLRHIKKETWGMIFCSKIAKGAMVALLVGTVLPTLSYFFLISRNINNSTDREKYYCLVREEFRIPCGKLNMSRLECEEIHCCFNATTGQCHHFLPSKYFYQINEDGTYTASHSMTPLGSMSIETIKLALQEKTSNKLSIIIHDSSETIESKVTAATNYSIYKSSKKLIVEVLDQDGDSIFTTAKGALIASNLYWEWSFQLSSGTIFGLDRNLIQLEPRETLTKVIYKNEVDHTTLPVFWAYSNGKFHAAVIKHDGPLEIEVLASNTIILRSLLGKKIEVELSLGPTPADLYKDQMQELEAPPLWFLGTHNCRKGSITTLTEILDIYKDNSDSSFDTDCIHENLFMALQNWSTPETDVIFLKSYIQEAISAGKKFMLSLPPHVLIDENNELYQTAKELHLVYKHQSGNLYNGTYLNHKVVYLDYSNETAKEYVKTLINWLDSKIGMQHISGFVLNDNWPQDDSYKNVEKTDFPYYSDAINKQMQYTLPWNIQGTDKLPHLEKHNFYGQMQAYTLQAYLSSLSSEEPLIITSTKNYGNTEPEILEHFGTSWDNFRIYLNKILFNSVSGNRMVGLPICGDTSSYNKTLHETLCMRWYIAASTMPYFRVSSDVLRDPASLNSQFATKVAEAAIKRRKLLQDYFYTILKKGEPLVRPMYYDYYRNITTFSIERQYTMGKDIIVAHPFSSGRTKLQVYLPFEIGVWYEFWGGVMYSPKENDEYVGIDTLETDWTMLIAQGTIVALTESTIMQLYIALDCSSIHQNCTASGDLIKDGNVFVFSATNSSVTITGMPVNCNYSINYLRVYGYMGNFEYKKSYIISVDLCGDDGREDIVTINYLGQE